MPRFTGPGALQGARADASKWIRLGRLKYFSTLPGFSVTNEPFVSKGGSSKQDGLLEPSRSICSAYSWIMV